jgi:hypothetical protein
MTEVLGIGTLMETNEKLVQIEISYIWALSKLKRVKPKK